MRRARIGITAIFALNGSLFMSLFSRLPAIQERTGVSDGQLGLALLCAMLGLLASQPLAGALVSRLGSRPVVLLGALGYALGLVPVALSESFLALAAALAVAGAVSGPLDVAMNVHGLTIEQRRGRPILSGLHAAFSFGALAGAGAGGIVAGLGVGVVPHLSAVAAVGVVVAIAATRLLLPPEADAAPEGPRFARPTRALAVVGAFAICVVLVEGAVSDWGAIYLHDEAGASEGTAAAERGESPGPAVAAVSAMGYVGFIAGPPAIGGLAELLGLRNALLLAVTCGVLAFLLAGGLRAPRVATAR